MTVTLRSSIQDQVGRINLNGLLVLMINKLTIAVVDQIQIKIKSRDFPLKRKRANAIFKNKTTIDFLV